jgi:Xaa-Pro aminopeptidase
VTPGLDRAGGERFERLAAGLAERGCEALLVVARSAVDPDLAAFVGDVHLGEAFVLAPRDPARGPARLGYLTPMERDEAAATGLVPLDPKSLGVDRWGTSQPDPAELLAAVVAKGLELCGVEPGRIAFAGHGQAGVLWAAGSRLAAGGWTLVPGNDLVLHLRKKKTLGEMAAIRAVAEGACGAFRAVARLLAAAEEKLGGREGELWLEGEPLRLARLRTEIARTLAGYGLEQPRGSIVAAGSESAVPHSAGDPDHVLRAGEALIVDLYPHGRLFADCTRTFCVGEPPEALARAHAQVEEALALAHRRARPGARGWDLQEEVCALLGGYGHPTPISHPGTTVGYVHGLGHGVGFDLHEYPSFRKDTGAEGLLAEGDVITLEPGLYQPEGEGEPGWGVRLEDLVVLAPEGPELLTPLPYDLDPRAWD